MYVVVLTAILQTIHGCMKQLTVYFEDKPNFIFLEFKIWEFSKDLNLYSLVNLKKSNLLLSVLGIHILWSNYLSKTNLVDLLIVSDLLIQ